MSDLGVIKMRTQRWEEALTLFSFVFQGRRDLLGEMHPLTIKTQSNYGICLVHADDKENENNLLLGEEALLRALSCAQSATPHIEEDGVKKSPWV
jgi:hypothetical protein